MNSWQRRRKFGGRANTRGPISKVRNIRKSNNYSNFLDTFKIVVGIFLSFSTAIIGWKTYELNEKASVNNQRLKEIEAGLTERKFDFEHLKEIYDRTERYLSSEQDERRGRALVVLIHSLPESPMRTSLLGIVTVEAKDESVRVAAAESTVGNNFPAMPKNVAFFGKTVVETLPDGQKIKTLSEFGFTDSKGVVWTVPKGVVLNGSGIPRALWSVVGNPLTAKYRIPAMIHEYYSTERTRSRQDVHRMFYEAMLASDVDVRTARTLYAATQIYSPRWTEQSKAQN